MILRKQIWWLIKEKRLPKELEVSLSPSVAKVELSSLLSFLPSHIYVSGHNFLSTQGMRFLSRFADKPFRPSCMIFGHSVFKTSSLAWMLELHTTQTLNHNSSARRQKRRRMLRPMIAAKELPKPHHLQTCCRRWHCAIWGLRSYDCLF